MIESRVIDIMPQILYYLYYHLLVLSEGPQSIGGGLEDKRFLLLSIALAAPTVPFSVYSALKFNYDAPSVEHLYRAHYILVVIVTSFVYTREWYRKSCNVQEHFSVWFSLDSL